MISLIGINQPVNMKMLGRMACTCMNCHGDHDAILHLSSSGVKLSIVCPHCNHGQVAWNTNEPNAKEHLVRNLVLCSVSALDVDDTEEDVGEQHYNTRAMKSVGPVDGW